MLKVEDRIKELKLNHVFKIYNGIIFTGNKDMGFVFKSGKTRALDARNYALTWTLSSNTGKIIIEYYQ